MTEDDTFNKLKRTPLAQMEQLLWADFIKSDIESYDRYTIGPIPNLTRDLLLADNGWILDDYRKALKHLNFENQGL